MPAFQALVTGIPVQGWLCLCTGLAVLALAAAVVVGRREVPVAVILLFGAAVGAVLVALEPIPSGWVVPGSWFVALGLLVAGVVWSMTIPLTALAVFLRPGAPATWTPRRAVPSVAVGALAAVPVLLADLTPVARLLCAVAPMPVVLLSLRDSARTRAAARDLGLLQLAAGLALLGAAVGAPPTHFAPVIVLPTVALAIAALASNGIGPGRRAIAFVGPPALLAALTVAASIELSTRTRRELWSLPLPTLPEVVVPGSGDEVRLVPTDACVVRPDGPACEPGRWVFAWPPDRPVSRELSLGANPQLLALRDASGWLGTAGVQIGLGGEQAAVLRMSRRGSGYELADVYFPDLGALLAGLPDPGPCGPVKVVLWPEEDWTPAELAPICVLAGCVLDRVESSSPPCRWDGAGWVPIGAIGTP